MKDIQDIIVFLGLYIRWLLGFMVIQLLFLIAMLAIWMLGFYIYMKGVQTATFYFFYPLVTFFIASWLRSRVLKSREFMIHLTYEFYFKKDSTPKISENFLQLNKQLQQTRRALKKGGSGLITPLLTPIVTAHSMALEKETIPNSHILKKLSALAWRTKLKEFAGIALLTIPFAGVTILLTWNLALPLKVFVALMACLFVWFLQGTIIKPIVRLALHKNILDLSLF